MDTLEPVEDNATLDTIGDVMENNGETTDVLLEPLLPWCESLQSCGSDILADGWLDDLIRRVATFGMVLMELDLCQ